MRQLLIFVAESKSENENSDGVYLRETLNYYYEFNRNQTIIKFVFMNGKRNYNKRNIINKINNYIKNAKITNKDTIIHVFYIFDKDNNFTSNADRIFNKNVIEYCHKNGYSIIWMNKNIEDVCLHHEVEKRQKTKEASKFKTSYAIHSIDKKKLSQESANTRHTSNILIELDKVLHRK